MTRKLFGQCDCCAAINRPLHCIWINGVMKVHACAKCADREEDEEMEDVNAS